MNWEQVEILTTLRNVQNEISALINSIQVSILTKFRSGSRNVLVAEAKKQNLYDSLFAEISNLEN